MMNEPDDQIPPTDPPSHAAIADPPSTRKKPGPKPKPKLKGSDLLVDLTDASEPQGETMVFWAGIFPECPLDMIHLGGQVFQKSSARLVVEEQNPNKHEKTPRMQLGNFIHLTPQTLKDIKAAMKRTVVRSHSKPIPVQEKIAGAELASDSAKTRKVGKLIKIHTPAEIEARTKAGFPAPVYVAEPGDKSVAEYIWAQPAVYDKAEGCYVAESIRPPSLAETGLEWPKG